MYPIGQLHLASAIVALLAGTWVVLRNKGTATHRRVGWLYAISMLTLNVTALLIYRLTGTFGPFHIAAVVSLATLIAGIIPAWRRQPADKWLDRHYFFMAYSYMGLLAAAVAETATRVPAVQAFAGGPTPIFWMVVVVVSVAVFIVGGSLTRRRFLATTQPFRQASV
ncbi:MAG TPA: DUF2306 domain-containing protein [Gemmatimonadaceae bacterium]|nr:DUF2306 domain-containing protein [Gemmatimonadaceae bacterium]